MGLLSGRGCRHEKWTPWSQYSHTSRSCTKDRLKIFSTRRKIFEELLKNISIITHLALVALAGGLIAHDAGFALVTGPALLLEVGDKLGAANKLTLNIFIHTEEI